MTRAAFDYALMSPSRRAGTIIRSTKLPLEADLMLPTIAHECGHDNVSEFARAAFEFYSAAKKAAHAAALKAAMHTGRAAVFLVALVVPALSMQPNVEMRRTRELTSARASAFPRRSEDAL